MYWALTTFGLVTIVTQSHLFAPLRDRFALHMEGSAWTPSSFVGTLLRCPMCLGWWSGAGLWLLGLRPVEGPPPHHPLEVLLAIWLAGCASSAVCWSGHVVLVKLGNGRE